MQTFSNLFWMIIFVLILGQNLFGQSSLRPPCGQEFFKDKSQSQVLNPPFNKQIIAPSSIQRNQLIIPIVIHVVWHAPVENISDELIISQIDALNRDFNAQNHDLNQIPSEFQGLISNVGISFCLASKTPTGQKTNGIIRVMTSVEQIGIKESLFFDSSGGSSTWDSEKYLNIWIANTGTLVSGFATYPGQSPPERTGVVINPKYFGCNEHPRYGKGRTLVHEIGHYFGLKHVWSHDPFCEDDDGVEDTPKQEYEHTGCPTYPQASCTESDMFMNFMDYVDDPCMLLFSKGQKEKIWTNIDIFRPGLLNNNVEYYCLQPNLRKDLGFVISPNPLTDKMTITFSYQDIGLVTVQVFDSFGRLRKHQKMLANNSLDMSMDNLEPGIYFIKIGTNARVLVKT